ncbi:MAG: TIGR02266 family protein [Myxococcota bacterium]
MATDRRRSERVALKIPVDYSSVDSFFSEFSANINEGGIFVRSERSVPLGSVVQLQFKLPGRERPLQMKGRVAWTESDAAEDNGIGIEFLDLSPEVREEINEVVRSLRKVV